MKKLFSLLAVLTAVALCGSEIDLSSLSPSDTAVAGKLDIAVLLQMPQVRQFLPTHSAAAAIRYDDVEKVFCGSDARLKRGFAICKFRNAAAWQRLWRTLDGRLTPLPAERRILLFEVKNSVRPPAKVYFAVLAPLVAGFYYEPSGKGDFRCDYSGAPAAVRKYYHAATPFVLGGRVKKAPPPLSGVRAFYFAPGRDRDGMAAICGNVVCSEPLAASLTIVALQGTISVYLQEFLKLTPEQTADALSRIKMYQYGKKIRIEFSDFSYLTKLWQRMAVRR